MSTIEEDMNETETTRITDENGKQISWTSIDQHNPEKYRHPRMNHWNKTPTVSWKLSSDCPNGASQHLDVGINVNSQRLIIQATEGYVKGEFPDQRFINRQVYLDIDRETAIKLTKLLQQYIDVDHTEES